MNKKLKLIIPLLSAATLLASCGGGETPSETPALAPTSIRLSRLNLGLVLSEEYDDYGDPTGVIIGEEYQLEVSSLPRQEKRPVIKFSSSDEKVATVDEKGLVKAVGEGKCEIIASSEDGEVKTSCPVFVGLNKTRNEAKKIADAIKKAQTDSGLSPLDTVREYCYWNNKISKNDKVQSDSYFDRETILSKSNAYFYMDDSDTTIKVEDGSPSYAHSRWVIYTNEYYDTYLFHINGDARTYMVADSTSFIDKGKSRYDAMCAVLDSLFTAGSSLATGKLTDALGTQQGGPISGASSSKRRASSGEGELIVSTAQSGKQTADREDESDYNIPAGTKYDVDIKVDYVMTENYCKSENVYQGMLYELGEDKYENAFYVESDYQVKDIELIYPDTADYQLVDSIFDL